MAKRQLLFPVLILLLAALVRVASLDIKPPHFDEGINGWFVDQMTKNGFYAYDPTNYHGPLHFYVLFVSLHLFGRNLWALRIPVVLVSLIAIFWILLVSTVLQPDHLLSRRARNGDFSRIHFLRSLLHS